MATWKVSASPHRFAENVLVLAVVVAEAELGNVERQIFRLTLCEGSDHAALQRRQEALDGICVWITPIT